MWLKVKCFKIECAIFAIEKIDVVNADEILLFNLQDAFISMMKDLASYTRVY